jgi:hypothetical protein
MAGIERDRFRGVFSSQANPSRDDPRSPPRPLERLGGAAPERAVVAPDAHSGRGEADAEREDGVEAPVLGKGPG